jgi:PAS domain S-box-containing protein
MINQAIMTDITDEKKAESRLKASEEKYKSLFESSVDAIVLVKDGKLVDLNPSALKIFGYEREDIIGKTPWAVSPRRQPDGSLSKESALDRINRVLAGEPQLFTWRHRRFDGTEFDTFVGLSAVKYDGEEMIQAVIRLEISEHFRLLGGFTQ